MVLDGFEMFPYYRDMTRLSATLSKLREEGRFRVLSPAIGIDFTSND